MKNSADLGGCYPPQPSASVDNTLPMICRILHILLSLIHIIAKYITQDTYIKEIGVESQVSFVGGEG